MKNQTKQQPENKSNNIFPTKILAEIIVFVAMAGAFALVSHFFFELPQGGTINIGMVPIFWLALGEDQKSAYSQAPCLAWLTLQLSHSLLTPPSSSLTIHLAFACLGLAGFFRKPAVVGPIVGVVVGGTGRFLSHFTSGVIYFPQYAPVGMSPIVYSAIYNGTYMVPSIIICAFAIYLLRKVIP